MPPVSIAITQTLSKNKHKLCVFTQMDRLKKLLLEIFKYIPYIYYRFTFELTLNNVIHAHGYVTCEADDISSAKIIYNELSKSCGFCCIKPIPNLEGWINYMTKDLSTTLKLLNAVASVKEMKELKKKDLELCRVSKYVRNDLREKVYGGTPEIPATNQESINSLEVDRNITYLYNDEKYFRILEASESKMSEKSDPTLNEKENDSVFYDGAPVKKFIKLLGRAIDSQNQGSSDADATVGSV